MNKGTASHVPSLVRRMLLLLSILSATTVLSAPLDEYTLKLVYLYNFTKFVRWQDNTTADTTAPFRICVIGNLPAQTNLAKLNERTSLNRRIEAVEIDKLSDSSTCHILFLTKSLPERESRKLLNMELPDTLVVGETSNFARELGDIGFVLDGDKHIRIEINLDHTEHKSLTIRAPLLEIARKVYREEREES